MRPLTAILENVEGLSRGGQSEFIISELQRLDYTVVLFKMSPTQVGLPQDRPRLYFMLLRSRDHMLHGTSSDTVAAFAQGAMSAIKAGHPLVPLDRILYDEEHPYICKMRALERDLVAHRQLSSSRPSASSTQKWVEKHRTSAMSCSRSHWTDSLAESMPGYLLLPDRQKDLLDLHGVRFPEAVPSIMNLSQGHLIGGKRCNVSPTITPGGYFWVAHRGRRLYGREALHLQGIFL
jgi:site-specific DNA-cytosine methylase